MKKTDSNGFWLDAHGAVWFRWNSYCAVRCGLKKSGILRYGSVPFSAVVIHKVRFGAVTYPTTVRFGAVFQYRQTCGAVRFGFQESKNPTVRFGAVNRTEPHRPDRKNHDARNPEKNAHDTLV